MPINVPKQILLISLYFGENWDNLRVGWLGVTKYTLVTFRYFEFVNIKWPMDHTYSGADFSDS